MRKVFLICSLVLIGVVAPILACSDNSGKTGLSAMEAPEAQQAVCNHTEQDTGSAAALIPWSETKNLSNNEINQILQKKPLGK